MTKARPLADMSPDELRQAVADRYGQVATRPDGTFTFPVGRAFAEAVGYPPSLLDFLPTAATASFAGVTYLPPLTQLQPGNVVVDLGCGAGLDTLIAAKVVGPSGRVHGVDFSSDMVALARSNAKEADLGNVEIHQAPVESVPLGDAMADVIQVNGVFNLAPEKKRAAAEAFRLLKPGGRLVGGEIVLTADVSPEERSTLDDWFRCIGGALPEPAFHQLLQAAGFTIEPLARGRNARTGHPASTVLTFRAIKPGRADAGTTGPEQQL